MDDPVAKVWWRRSPKVSASIGVQTAVRMVMVVIGTGVYALVVPTTFRFVTVLIVLLSASRVLTIRRRVRWYWKAPEASWRTRIQAASLFDAVTAALLVLVGVALGFAAALPPGVWSPLLPTVGTAAMLLILLAMPGDERIVSDLDRSSTPEPV